MDPTTPLDLSSLLDVFTLLGMALVVLKAHSLLKYVFAKDVNGIVSTVTAWLFGVAVAFLYGAADLAAEIEIAGTAITDMDVASKIILGIALGSLASTVYDFRKARNNADPSVEPSLVGGYEAKARWSDELAPIQVEPVRMEPTNVTVNAEIHLPPETKPPAKARARTTKKS